MLKIEQIQYVCQACNENTATVLEYRTHCDRQSHKFMKSKLASNNNNDGEAMSPSPHKKMKIL